MKRIIAFVLALVTSVTVFSCKDNKSDNEINFKLSVTCGEVVENIGSETYGISEEKIDIVPQNGIIFQNDVSCADGRNAYEIIIELLQKEKLHYEASDGYIKSIGNIYEGDCGKYSGWMFYVNGEIAEVGASDYVVKAGDEIEFKYIVDYMKLFE